MESVKPVFSVHELNEYIDLLLGADPTLKVLAVEGELEGVKRHPSGHLYFMLKDELASVNCVMFRQNVAGLRFLPKDGQHVRLAGRAALYPRDGRFQLMATGLTLLGAGSLYAAFAEYKEKLTRLGWFDASQKKQIPLLPKAIGLITSAGGSVQHDVVQVTGRRFPSMPIVFYPTAVQGPGAAQEIADAIDRADAEKRCDVLIVGRGGGSMEDLWAFNEPTVVEAIHRCSIPVISAVGHETDFSISDFVADLRAPTPSAAAELAVPERSALLLTLSSLENRLQNALKHGVRAKRDRLSLLWGDAVRLRMQRFAEQKRQALDETHAGLLQASARMLETQRNRLEREHERLLAYSPQRTLERGFALIGSKRGHIITSLEGIDTGDSVLIRFADGTAQAKIIGKETV